MPPDGIGSQDKGISGWPVLANTIWKKSHRLFKRDHWKTSLIISRAGSFLDVIKVNRGYITTKTCKLGLLWQYRFEQTLHFCKYNYLHCLF